MSERVDFYNTAYKSFSHHVQTAIRQAAFGTDIGQDSWITADEYERFATWLNVTPESHVLEVASGSGGPALHLAKKFGCRVTGIDVNENAIATANESIHQANMAVSFQRADATQRLPFDNATFDAVLCIDSINHFPDRLSVLREWYRVLKPARRILYTDPVLITGPVTNEELAARSSIGLFLFVPPGTNERWIADAGFHLARSEDATDNIAQVSQRWHAARIEHHDDLLQIEGAERFEGVQKFFAAVHKLSSERRLSRYVFLANKE